MKTLALLGVATLEGEGDPAGYRLILRPEHRLSRVEKTRRAQLVLHRQIGPSIAIEIGRKDIDRIVCKRDLHLLREGAVPEAPQE